MQTKSSKIVALFLVATTIVANQSSWGYNNNWADASNTQAYGNAASNGNGYSAVSASKNGVTTQAYGTNGSLSNSGFNQNTNSWGVSNGYNNNPNGNNAYSNNWADNSATQAQTNAVAFGQGGVASNVGRDGGNVFAQGTLGTVSQLQYNNSENAWNTQFAYGNNRRLLTDNNRNNRYYSDSDSDSCEDDNNYNRNQNNGNHQNNGNNQNNSNHQNNGNSWGWNNNWADNSKTNAYGEAQSYGNGYSAVSAGKKGVNTEAYGKEGAASKSAFEQNNNSWGVSNGFNNNGKGNNAFSNNWGSNDATKSFTQAQGFGEAGVKSQNGKDGADVFAQGTKGTNTGLGWQNNDNNWNSSFAFGNNKRNLMAHKQESCSDEDDNQRRQPYKKYGLSDQDKKLVDDLRKEIYDLKKANEELRRQCGKNNGKGLGTSNE